MTPAQFRSARIKLGMTQGELAQMLGVHDSRTVRRWELGERSIPPMVQIIISYWVRDLELGQDRIAFY